MDPSHMTAQTVFFFGAVCVQVSQAKQESFVMIFGLGILRLTVYCSSEEIVLATLVDFVGS